MTEWKSKEASTIEIKIFIAGDYGTILSACRKYCAAGFCVSIKAVDFVFKHGMESGAEITLINYPRFPQRSDGLWSHAEQLALLVATECFQGSYTIQNQLHTVFYSRRDGD